MRIACVAYLHGAGGAERQIIMLANAMAQKGHTVHLIILADNKSKYEISKKIIVHDLSKVEEVNSSILRRFFALKNELKNIKPDYSIHYWLQSAYFCSVMKKEYCGKIIYSERGDPGDAEYNGTLGLIRKVAFRRIDGFVFQSEGARDYFGKEIRDKSIIIHNAVSVPPDKYTAPCDSKISRVLNVGRLHPQKNQKLLINAFSIFSKSYPDYTLEIIGDGELKEELIAHASELGIKDKVIISPSRSDIFDVMYSSRLFVLSSDFEGMPNVLLEAMALGVACIACDCKPGGAKTLISDGINGFIVPRNNAEILASKMIEVISNEEVQSILCENAQRVRHTHTVGMIYDLWESFLNDL